MDLPVAQKMMVLVALPDLKRFELRTLIKLKTTHKFIESQAAKAIVGQTIY